MSAGSSGGSGEIEVIWNAAVGAEIYRVYRATAVGGPFIIVATVNIVTGDTSVHSGVVNVFGDKQNFWPRPYHGTGVSATFHYVELAIGGKAGNTVPEGAIHALCLGEGDGIFIDGM